MNMMDESKSIKQEEGISIWAKNNFHGTLNYVMRFGKTRIIDLVIQRTRAKHIDKRICLLVPTDIAYQNVKYMKDSYNIEIYTKNTLNNLLSVNPKFEGYLLIVDEIHSFLNEKYSNILFKAKFDYKLGLTGSTLTVTDKNTLRRVGMPVVDIITEQEAISKGWLAEYSEYNVAIPIRDSEKLKYKALNDNIKEIADNFRGIFIKVNNAFGRIVLKSDYELLQSCYSGLQTYINSNVKGEFIIPDKVRLIVAALMGYEKDKVIQTEHDYKIQQYWNPDNIQTLAKSYIKSVTARNNYLKHNVNKVNAVLRILKYNKVPTIVYNDSIPMIDQIYESLDPSIAVKYHSQIESTYMYYEDGSIIRYLSGEREGEPKLFGKTTIKKQAIERIKSGQALYLITGKSLNESLDLPNIECIICTAGDINPQTYEQRVARGKTIDSTNNNKRCIIINLFIDDFILNNEFISSRDKEKLETRQINNKNVIWLENIDDLFASIKNYI